MGIIIFLGLVAIAVVVFILMLQVMLRSACPTCQKENGTDETIIPILPGYMWWCPGCNNTCKQNELVLRSDYQEADE